MKNRYEKEKIGEKEKNKNNMTKGKKKNIERNTEEIYRKQKTKN